MKVILGVLMWLILSTVSLAQDSLGDVARQQRAINTDKKQSAKVITNDDLPRADVAINGAVAVPGGSDDSATDKTVAKQDQDKAGAQEKEAKEQEAETEQEAPPQTDAEREKAQQELRARYDEEKKKTDLLDRELKVLQREYEIQTAEFYADAGTRLRDDKEWAAKHRQYETDIAAKQKEVEDAKQKLETTKEEARQSGMPPRMLEP